MLDLYRSGDPYLNFGKIIGYIPPDATRKTPGIEAIRDRLKVLCLGTQYGMQTATLATRLGVSEHRSARDAAAPSRAVLAILALVRRLAAPLARQRHDAHRVRLAMRDRNHRIQRALDPQLAGPEHLR